MNKKLFSFFNPQSIAIVGASEDPGSVGSVISKNILNLGYAGRIFPVNPKRKKIYGEPCFSSLEAIPEKIDLAIIAVPSFLVFEIIKNSSDEIKNFVIISAGFSETGKEGREREENILKLSQEKNLNVLGPNCLGFIVPKIKLNASFAGGMPPAGDIAFISQSGALAVALMDMAREKNIGFSKIISVGNKMLLSESEILEYLSEDENTKVIGVYLEGIKDGRKFLETAGRVSEKKPIIILKTGKSELAQEAISSHTGALAGSDAIADALFEKAGVIRVVALREFFNSLRMVSFVGAPKNNKTAVVTNAGGIGVLTADEFQNKKISLAEFSQKTKNSLRAALSKESSVENPVDLLGDAREGRYREALELLSKENIGIYICALTPQDQTPVEAIAETIIDFKNKNQNKTVAAVFVGGGKVAAARKKLENNFIACFEYPEEAVRALDNCARWEKSKKTSAILKNEKTALILPRAKKAREIIETAKKEGREALFFKEGEKIMNLYGIKTIATWTENEVRMREISFPAVVKIDSDKILHKTDKGGVALDIQNKKELLAAIGKMKKKFPRERIIVQSEQKIQTELILGVKRDPSAETAVLIGLGGIYAEIFKTSVLLIPPLSRREIEKKIMTSSLNFLFQKTRGQKPHNLAEIVKIAEKMILLAMEIKEIRELDINPLFIYNNKRPALAADIKVVI